MTATTTAIHPVESKARQKSEAEREIERLSRLSPEALAADDLMRLEAIRNYRASLVEGENELAEVKERVKLRKKALEQAVKDAVRHVDNRRMAQQLKLAL